MMNIKTEQPKGWANNPIHDMIREAGLDPVTPLRTAYSRQELADNLKDWMIELWGDTPKNLDSDQRDQWHRDNGLIYHFICDHFPVK